MNKAINRALVVFAVLTLVFGVLLWLYRDSKGNAEYYEGSNSVSLCEYIELELLKTNVELIPYDGDEIRFEFKSTVPITVKKGDNRLVVTESDEFVLTFMTSESEQLGFRLYLPEVCYRSITVYTSSGAVSADGVLSEEMNVVTKSGDISVTSCSTPVKLTSGTGDILLDFDDAAAGSVIEARSGNAKLILPRGSSVALSYKTETGRFISDMISGSIDGSYMLSFSGGERLINADVISGTFTVSEKTD